MINRLIIDVEKLENDESLMGPEMEVCCLEKFMKDNSEFFQREFGFSYVEKNLHLHNSVIKLIEILIDKIGVKQ